MLTQQQAAISLVLSDLPMISSSTAFFSQPAYMLDSISPTCTRYASHIRPAASSKGPGCCATWHCQARVSGVTLIASVQSKHQSYRVGCVCCRRSSQLAASVVHQFRHAVATNTHRLSDTSGPSLPHPNGSVGSDHSFTVGSPAQSTSSAPLLADDLSNALAGDHVAIDMEPEGTSRLACTRVLQSLVSDLPECCAAADKSVCIRGGIVKLNQAQYQRSCKACRLLCAGSNTSVACTEALSNVVQQGASVKAWGQDPMWGMQCKCITMLCATVS